MARVYAIKSNQIDKCYIGSTTKTLEERLSKHKTQFVSWKNNASTKYVTSYDILVYGDAYIELIEECEIEVRFEREKFHMIHNQDKIVNKQIPTRTWDEYYKSNREHRIANSKAYAEANKEKRAEYQKAYAEANKEKRAEYQKTYREANKKK